MFLFPDPTTHSLGILPPDIASYILPGLPIAHGLAVGWRAAYLLAAEEGTVADIRRETDSEERDLLEKVIQAVDGNALAVKIVFTELQRAKLAPRELLERVLTGDIRLHLDILSRSQADMRFYREVILALEDWRLSVDMMVFLAQDLLAPFTLVIPRHLMPFFLFFTEVSRRHTRPVKHAGSISDDEQSAHSPSYQQRA